MGHFSALLALVASTPIYSLAIRIVHSNIYHILPYRQTPTAWFDHTQNRMRRILEECLHAPVEQTNDSWLQIRSKSDGYFFSLFH